MGVTWEYRKSPIKSVTVEGTDSTAWLGVHDNDHLGRCVEVVAAGARCAFAKDDFREFCKKCLEMLEGV